MAKHSKRLEAILTALLALLNLVALNFLVLPLRARMDLTQEREYTLSEATRRTLAALPDHLEIIGYFSDETHPKLAPLIPKLRDLVEEYRTQAPGRVVVRFLDPRMDEGGEKEAARRFGVQPVPVPIESKFESGVKSIYFALVISFGDRTARIELDDLIEVSREGPDRVSVRLRNTEYQLTRAIDKVVREFGTLEARLAERKTPVKLLFFVSGSEGVPEGELRDYVAKRRKQLSDLADELRKRYKSGFEAELVDPAAKPDVVQRYGVQPLRAMVASQATFYLDAVVEADQRGERVAVRDLPDRERTPAEIRDAVEGAIRRLTPGALRKVGVVGPKPDLPPQLMLEYYKRGEKPPGDDFEALRSELRRGFDVQDLSLNDGRPPLDVDVLLVLRPKDWTEKRQLALDQYLMYGGKAIVCVDEAEYPPSARSIELTPIQPKLDEMLAKYGVTVRKELVEDDRNVPMSLPAVRDVGGFKIQVIEKLAYPWFLDVRGDSIDRSNPVVGSVDHLELLWASPLSVDPEKTKGLRVSKLVTSSDRAWTTADLRDVQPSTRPYQVPDKTARETLAVSLEGRLASAFKDRPDLATRSAGVEPVFESPDTTRLVVIGDSDFVSDLAARGMPSWKANVRLIENLVDSALLDEALVRIRARGAADRPIRELSRETKKLVEAANYAVPIGLVIVFGLVRWLLRRRATRRTRSPARAEGSPSGASGAVPATGAA